MSLEIVFGLDQQQVEKLSAWLDLQNAALAARQEADPAVAPFVTTTADGRKFPYLGAVGGALTYSFTPTGLGIVIEATYCKGTGDEATLNLTDYDTW